MPPPPHPRGQAPPHVLHLTLSPSTGNHLIRAPNNASPRANTRSSCAPNVSHRGPLSPLTFLLPLISASISLHPFTPAATPSPSTASARSPPHNNSARRGGHYPRPCRPAGGGR
ncbi:MAG: hypothetical protein ACK5TN_04330, partial [Acidobacteriota bacterium]